MSKTRLDRDDRINLQAGIAKGYSLSMISKILSDERYTGKLIAGKFKKAYVGSKKVIPVPEDEIVVVENTHEAIISKSDFDTVQRLLKYEGRWKDGGDVSIFNGVLMYKDAGLRDAVLSRIFFPFFLNVTDNANFSKSICILIFHCSCKSRFSNKYIINILSRIFSSFKSC